MTPLVSALAVFHDERAAAETVRAVRSLRDSSPDLPLEFVLADNRAVTAPPLPLAGVAQLRTLAFGRNLGFGAAVNRAAREARGEYLLLLNPDLEARPGALEALLAESARHPEAAVIAPLLLYPDKTVQYSARRFYRWRTVLVRRSPLRRLWRGGREDRRHLYLDQDPRSSHEADWVTGACWLLRRADFLALGGFDERFFVYFEDVDFCLRAWRAGRRVRRCGGAVFVHAHRRESAGLRPSRVAWWHLQSMLRFVRKHGGWPRREGPLPGRPLVFVNQGQGALGERAAWVARNLGGWVLAKDQAADTAAGRLAAALRDLLVSRPPLVYVIDVGLAAAAMELGARLRGARVILDTGDEHLALQRRTARYRGARLELHGAAERLCQGLAHTIIARGRGHVEALRARGYNDVRWIPDGVDAGRFADGPAHPWREERGWTRALVVASVSSLYLDRRYHGAPGAELVEALALLPSTVEVRGVILGDGEARGLLEERARALGVADRVAFLGQRPPDELPAYLRSFDVCLSTQTNDAVGQARTTGKLPLFLAAGRFVLASDVGEAARVLPRSMLLRYDGEHDPAYPARLAARLAELRADRSLLAEGRALPCLARELFDYTALAPRLRELAAPGEAR